MMGFIRNTFKKRPLILSLSIFNGFFSIVYFGGVITAILFLSVTAISNILPREISSAFLVVSFVFMVVSIIGMYGAISARRAILWINGMLSLVIVLIFVTAGSFLLFKRTDLKGFASPIWNNFGDTTKSSIQGWGQCCGFDSYSDRPFLPCKEFQPKVGCWNAMEEWFSKSTLSLVILFFSLATLQAIACILVLLLLNLIPKSIDIARGRRRATVGGSITSQNSSSSLTNNNNNNSTIINGSLLSTRPAIPSPIVVTAPPSTTSNSILRFSKGSTSGQSQTKNPYVTDSLGSSCSDKIGFGKGQHSSSLGSLSPLDEEEASALKL